MTPNFGLHTAYLKIIAEKKRNNREREQEKHLCNKTKASIFAGQMYT
jgi:hypothetical protein